MRHFPKQLKFSFIKDHLLAHILHLLSQSRLCMSCLPSRNQVYLSNLIFFEDFEAAIWLHTIANFFPYCTVFLFPECPKQDNVVLPVYGLSTTYQAVLPSCLAEVEAKIGSFLLPPQEFVALPMKLPSRCVIRQISNLYPAKQRFQNVLGINSQPYTCSQYF